MWWFDNFEIVTEQLSASVAGSERETYRDEGDISIIITRHEGTKLRSSKTM